LTKKIDSASELLGCTYDEALILYHHFKWNKDSLENSSWFENSDKVRQKAGLPLTTMKRATAFNVQQLNCPICLASVTISECDWLPCNHVVCKFCWQAFVSDKVTDKATEFFWNCPGEQGKKCYIIVPDSFNRKYLLPDKVISYEKKLCVAYAEENRAIRWCPAPDCIYCVENVNLSARPVICKCTYVYCFKCGKEDHRPCDCKKADEWQSKNKSESENTRWILLFTKMCPKCGKPIEKNQGCNHMTCRHKSCGYEFCWLCLEDWKGHQGTHYKCNKFEALSEEEKKTSVQKMERERTELEKYIWYFERYSNHDKSLSVATQIQKRMEDNMLTLHDRLSVEHGEVAFLLEAAVILRNARRTLKWSYAFGYYIDDIKVKSLFEFHQKDLENYTEELQEWLEIKYTQYFGKKDVALKEFREFKDAVMGSAFKCNKFMTEFLKCIDEGWLQKLKENKL